MNRRSRRAVALITVGILLVAGTIAGGVWLGLHGDRPPAVSAPTSPQPTTLQPTTPQPTGPEPTSPQPTTQPTSPHILSVTTIPVLPRQGGFLRLPAGAGTLTFGVRAINTTEMRFYVTPTGTEMFKENQLIGQDTNGRDGWTLAWRYQDQPLLAHLTVKAIGLGGTADSAMLGLYHPEPNS
jgi:hypothetical protein